MADAYAAADAVVLPSTWEGFGLPLIESALAERPLAVSDYRVAQEVARLGFAWLPVDDPAPLAAWFADPDPALLARNSALAKRHFGPSALIGRLADTLARAGLPCRPPLGSEHGDSGRPTDPSAACARCSACWPRNANGSPTVRARTRSTVTACMAPAND